MTRADMTTRCPSMFSRTRGCHREHGHKGLHETTFNGVNYAWKGHIVEEITLSDKPQCPHLDPWNGVQCEDVADHDGYHRAGRYTWITGEVAS